MASQPNEEVAFSPPPGLVPSSPMRLTIPTGLSMDPEVVSPKPLHSPKQSYSVDPFTHATLAKSERVETLERIAASAERKFSDMSKDVPEMMSLEVIDKNKTLPAPPVPTGKARIISNLADSRPTAEDFFAPAEVVEETPPTPTLAAVTSTSLKVPRLGGGLSGLDALEARLLAEVGTRKLDQDDRRPDVRSVLPINIPRPPQEDPANDSAISSLNLPGLGADEMTKIGKANSAHSGATYRDGQRGRSRERDRKKAKEPSDETAIVEKRDKKKKEKHGAGRDQEAYRLRKAAQGRIAAWLDNVSPDSPSQHSTPEPDEEDFPIPNIREPASDEQGSKEVPVSTAVTVQGDPTTPTDVDALPNPRSSGFVPIATLKANQQAASSTVKAADNKSVKLPADLQKCLPVYPPRALDPEVRYDVRSARGGRGGKVTAVAAIWASATQNQNEVKPPTPRPPLPSKATKPSPAVGRSFAERQEKKGQRPKPAVPPKPNPPRFAERQVPRSNVPTVTANTDNDTPSAAVRRARLVKAASVPAVLSSSLATPMLSSTASLARPPALTKDKIHVKAQISSGLTDIREVSAPAVPPKTVPAVKTEMAFGQARLKELIKKYQGQANA